MFYYAAYIIRSELLPIASSFIVVTEQVRICLKMHAFVMETYRMTLGNQHQDEGKYRREMEILNQPEELFSKYVYFMFIPTLVYRNEYPMLPRISWAAVMVQFIRVFACLVFIYVIWIEYCLPLFKSPEYHSDFYSLAISVVNATVPAMAIYMCMFYGLLHCWMNLGAELTMFGDRAFYSDWWNARSYSSYYRKWNVVVGDWIYAYVYMHLQEQGLSVTVSQLCSFFLSALIHEYIITLATSFFFPVLFVLFAGFGVLFIFVTRSLRGSQVWNVFLWCTLFLGNGILLYLYAREWYLRNLVPAYVSTSNLIPFVFQPLFQ